MRLARVGAMAWPSFFAAAVATLVFFAVVDPSDLAEITWPHLAIRANSATPGILHVLGCTLAASAFTALLLSPASSGVHRMQAQRRSEGMNKPIPVSVVQDASESLYAAQAKVYPREITGASPGCA